MKMELHNEYQTIQYYESVILHLTKSHRIKQTKELLKQIRNNRLQLIRSKDAISQDLIKNRNPALKKHWEEELETLLNQITEIDEVIKEKLEELVSLENSKQLNGDQYHKILTEFNQILEDKPKNVQQDLIRTLIREAESKISSFNNGSGEFRIDYICDHYLISEWEDIKQGLKKKANSEKRFKVRTSLALGSPGRIAHIFLLPPLK